MGIDRSRRITFEEMADLYNEIASEYPGQLIEDILSLSDIPRGGRILEIGCGPGNATLPFARRGYRILAIELGPRLVAYAARNCRDYPDVQVVNTTFEDWEVEPGAFDLALSADAFHWIQPEIGYPKVARALKPGGSITFFWNAPGEQDNECSRAMSEVYRQRAPGFDDPARAFTVAWLIETVRGSIQASGCFGEVEVRLYDEVEALSTEQYLKRLRTYSSHREMDEAVRRHLYAGLREVILHFGGTVTGSKHLVLFQARVK
jgi:SAM-dependent methyltransferase